MEWLKSMLTWMLFILLKRNLQNDSSVEPYKEQIFFRSGQETGDSSFELIQK